ncbi:MAG: YraN family protein [Desulfobacterales bacterium]|jgi:putative endonuclease|nr:YraN family protein [Desulfobacterales bacterium]
MFNLKQIFGKQGEALAVKHLKQKGYEIICVNYKTRLGEIDIIARDKDTIVFVEVKSRRSSTFGSAKAAVTPDKQRRISKNALYYLKATSQMNARARFDVVAIDSSNESCGVEIIKNAFGMSYE